MQNELPVKWHPYPSYKDSGVEWLGEIPSHWKIERLKWSVDYCQNGIWGNDPDGENDLPCIRVADFDRIRNRINLPVPTLRAIPNFESRNFFLLKNDLLIEKSGGGDLQPVGVVVLYNSNEPAICSNFIARMSVKDEFESNFLCFLHSYLYSSRINTKSIKQNTGIQNLDTTAYLNEKVGIPPLPEQRAIADFLDRETARIDALITKYRRLIELLEEKRTSLISQAVTKGLDASVEMKDSGVEWLGKIPKHWNIFRLKNICSVNPRKDKVNILTEEIDVSFLPMESIGVGTINLNQTKKLTEVSQGFTHFIDNDVVVAKITPCFENGKGAIVCNLINGIGFGTTELHVLRTNDGLDNRFLYYITASYPFRKIAEGEMQGTAGQKRVTEQFIINFPVSLPPLTEQCAIAEFLDRETARIDLMKEKVISMITKLQEYRTALISAAVTGKIDVRN